MKKITFLTSVLALAACGGGSGGVAPTLETTIPVAELENTTFESGTEMRFNIEGDHIASIDFLNEDGTDTIYMKPNSNEIDKLYFGENDITVTPTEGYVETFGKHVGLQYSDFGHLYAKYDFVPTGGTETTTETINDYFIGGLNNKYLEAPETSKTFTGTAVATVNSDKTITNDGKIEFVNNFKTITTNDASLEVNLEDHEYVLNMDFSKSDTPWYTVSITDDGQMTVTDETNGKLNIEKDFQIAAGDTQTVISEVDAAFFGQNGIASEAVAQFHNTQYINGEGEDNQIYIHGAFGGIAK